MEKNDGNDLIPNKLTFEDLKKVNQYGMEYWSARDLQLSLGYSKWQRFENAIEKAIESCKPSGNDPKHHFTGAGKPITSGRASGIKGMLLRLMKQSAKRFGLPSLKLAENHLKIFRPQSTSKKWKSA